MFNEARDIVLIVNGEIYNHLELREKLEERAPGKHKFFTKSDCEVLLHLYAEDGVEFLSKNEVVGMFSFVIWDAKKELYIVARDTVGIIPLYMGCGKDGSVQVASELKALHQNCQRYELFPPGCIYDSKSKERRMYYTPTWWSPQPLPEAELALPALRDAFERSVISHLMSDVPYGVLLSGGLDSSLVASIMSRHCGRRMETDGRETAPSPQLHSFSIGLKGSPDLKAAREVASFLKTVHHEYVFTPQQGIDALSDVIYQIETFDVTKQPGVSEPLGYWDPLGLCPPNDKPKFRKLRMAELKHGRVAMLASVGLVAQHYVRFPAFEELPSGIGAPFTAAGGAGCQALVFACLVMEFVWGQDPNREVGDFGNPLRVDMYDAEMRNRELNNGRFAMFATAGILAAELVTGKDAVQQLSL